MGSRYQRDGLSTFGALHVELKSLASQAIHLRDFHSGDPSDSTVRSHKSSYDLFSGNLCCRRAVPPNVVAKRVAATASWGHDQLVEYVAACV